MNGELSPAIRKLAASMAARPPANLEAAVMAEFDRTYGRGRGPAPRFRNLAVGGALAASLLAGALLVSPAPKAVAKAETQAFFPIPYTPRLQPYERVVVVQTNVPVSELIAAGFHVQTSDPGGSVRADVMVSQDGRPRAIRPVVFSVSDRSNIR